MTDHTVMCVDDITQKHPYAGVVILGDSNRLRDASLSSYSLKQIVVGETRGRAMLDKIFTNIADWYKPSVILPEIGQSDHSTVLMLPNNQPRCQREGGGKRGLPPTKKLPPPRRLRAGVQGNWEGLLPVLRMHTQLKRLYSTRTVMKRTNFSGRFDKPGFKLSDFVIGLVDEYDC